MGKNLSHFILPVLLFLFGSIYASAQTTISGTVIDADTDEPLIGASVMVVGTSQGTVTDLDGNFTLSVSVSDPTLEITYIGYKDVTRKVGRSNGKLGIIKMTPDAVTLNDVIITSSIAVARKTPVALSTIQPAYIEERMGGQEFPEILKSTPGVYVSKEGGGYGDSSINMRGFKKENVAIMVNGVPMNDMEWGGVYWSNWTGLTDVTRNMQTQRGLGASKVSAPSVGGSINIITQTIDAKKGGFASYTMGNDGLNKVAFSVSTGLSESGWAFSLLGSVDKRDGYIQGTESEAYTWFVNIAKRFNEDHQLSLTAFGSAQWHDKRDSYSGLTIEGWQDVKRYMNGESPYKFNATYGYGLNGERKTSTRNKYHKPQISLNHLWQIDRNSSLSTALYASIGDGYGYAGQGLSSADRNQWSGARYGVLNTDFRRADGTYDYGKIYEINQKSEYGSRMVMAKQLNQHTWFGLLSTYTTKFDENWDFYGGIDLRHYKGVHRNEIVDLYGGEYFVDAISRSGVLAENHALAGTPDFVNQKLGVGDAVYRDYDGFVMSEGVFAQLEYNQDKVSAFVSGSFSNTGYWRYDRMYYDKAHAKSKTQNFLGGTVKGGVNYNVTENHNFFGNIGYISRAPFFSGGAFLQAQTSNVTNKDAVNEKIFSAELGYGYRSRYVNVNLNVYHTKWIDKTMTRSMIVYDDDNEFLDRFSINMSGVDALHQGIEMDFVVKPLNWLDITGMFSIGNWRWNSTATGYFYDSSNQPVKGTERDPATGDIVVVRASGIQAEDHAKMDIHLEGVKVGGSAQTTAALGANIRINKSIRIGADYNYIGRNYADWNFGSNDMILNGNKKYESPWRMPAAHTVDVNGSYKFKVGGLNATLSGTVHNLFDYEYITFATDGADHDWRSAYGVFYGFGRTYTMRMKINF